VPVFSITDGYMTVSGGGKYALSAQRFSEVPKFTAEQADGIEMFRHLCEELHHRQEFNPGDIQFLNNHVIQHSRTEFEDWEDSNKKRHLLRLWLEVPGLRPIHEAFATRINGIVVPGSELKVPLEAE
ncbi:MAG: TauD/TfdA family dioxygenase, partial [Pseudomonadota bacterium]|nr:TauD/TfdA family dioxygenase [Pseudomonadota bacterium]